MKILRSIGKKGLVFIAVIVLGIGLSGAAQAVTPEPGSDQNPLVTQDYVDSKVNDLANTINGHNAKIADLTQKNADMAAKLAEMAQKNADMAAKLAEMTQKNTDMAVQIQMLQQQSEKFTAIEIEAGKKVTFGAGAEFILRGGQAKAIGNYNAGLSDITSGKDLQTGAAVLYNHLILVAKDDGRGISTASKTWILVKGSYTIK